MRVDWYSKGVLTVIAVLLGMVVLKQYAKPPEPVAPPETPSPVSSSTQSGRHFSTAVPETFTDTTSRLAMTGR